MNTLTRRIRRPRGRYRVTMNRHGQRLRYPTIKVAREDLDQLEVFNVELPPFNVELPPRSSIPWRVERGPVTLIGFWVRGELSPHWYEAVIA